MIKDQENTILDTIIVDPEKIIFEGPAIKLMVPGVYQKLAILPDHTPLYAQLIKGEVEVITKKGQTQSYKIESGIIRVKLNRVSIITGFDAQGNVEFG